ncbi:pyrroline-5-carboxylate reductase 3-like [Amphibalanus amphitrite]|uniref:pyrroline-5-carboxylate reductase 3-like n=1 Tax=Amphibalanus amphitrite TaxID=1232801 RepID=UPI001C921867|nr:pyrroline-5-carboxylate reductase 3-like [Amphibalanus amphitrite]
MEEAQTETDRRAAAPSTNASEAAIDPLDIDRVEAGPNTLETIVLSVVGAPTESGAATSQEAAGDNSPSKAPPQSRRLQRYRSTWENIPELKDWLQGVDGDPYSAWCRHCCSGLVCHLKNLMLHARSAKHLKRSRGARPAPPPPPSARLGRGRRMTPVLAAPAQGGRRRTSRRAVTVVLPQSPQRSGGSPERSFSPAEDSPPPSSGYPTPSRPQPTADVSYGDIDRVNYSIGLHNLTVGFVGAGNIAKATTKGMLDKGIVSPACVITSAPTRLRLDTWRLWGCSTTTDNAEVVRESDLVLVAVQPLVAESVFAGLGAALTDGKERCFVSLVTGWTRQRIIETISSRRPVGAQQTPFHVVRCVPNLPVSIGEGSTVYCCGDDLPRNWLLSVEMVFSALGSCQKVDERLMDAYSGAFGSGTAYVLSFVDALASGAVHLGVPWHEALQMAAKTTAGAAQLLLDSDRPLCELSRDAAAAGGATLAGTRTLQKAGFGYAVMSAVEASAERSRQLGERPASAREGPAADPRPPPKGVVTWVVQGTGDGDTPDPS